MESATSKAERYERRYPDTGIGEAQKAERQERLDLKARRADGGRRGRRYHTVPALPWHQEEA